jgi:two-component system cell cycle response regulator
MSARILLVSCAFPLVKRIERMLVGASYDVAVATKAEDCLVACREGRFEVVLLDATSSDAPGIELCRRLKQEPVTAQVPAIVITDERKPGRRLDALDSGADEHLTFPIDEIALAARVRSLVRLKSLSDDVRRASSVVGLASAERAAAPGEPARVLVLDPDERSRVRLTTLMAAELAAIEGSSAAKAVIRAAEGAYDIAIVSFEWPDMNGSRLCRQLSAVAPSMRLLLVTDGEDLCLRHLEEIGVDDLLRRPIDRSEALARVEMASRKARLTAELRRIESIVAQPTVYRMSALSHRRPPDRFAA